MAPLGGVVPGWVRPTTRLTEEELDKPAPTVDAHQLAAQADLNLLAGVAKGAGME